MFDSLPVDKSKMYMLSVMRAINITDKAEKSIALYATLDFDPVCIRIIANPEREKHIIEIIFIGARLFENT